MGWTGETVLHRSGMREIALLTRVNGAATAVTSDLRAMIRRLDSEMPFYQVRTMEQVVSASVATSPQQVLTMVLREGLAQVGIGLILGMALAAATSRLLSGLLFGVTTAAVLPYVVVSVLLLASALVACLAPARRAMRIDPAVALRGD